MRRDIVIIASLDMVVVAIAASYLWMARYVMVGMASIHVAMLCALVSLICTAAAGALITRLPVGAVGIATLWVGFAMVDMSTSSASFGSVAINALLCAIVQFGVFSLTWWLGRSIDSYQQAQEERSDVARGKR